MTYELNRRTVLRGVGAGAIALGYAGPVAAAGDRRYLVSGREAGLQERIERAGFSVQRSLADGRVLLVIGEANRAGDLDSVSGVSHAVRDLQFRMEGPAKRSPFEDAHPVPIPSIDEELYHLQWDKEVTSVPAAHDRATGAGRSIAVIDTGVGVNHPNLAGNLDVENGRRFRALAVGEDLEDEVLAPDPEQGGSGPVEVPADRGDLTQGTTVLDDEVTNDVHGHGSNVSGIAAANPGAGLPVTGTAPDATVVPLRVFYWLEDDYDADGDDEVDENAAALFTTTGDILTAIDYAAELGVDAMNMSIGTPPIPPQGNRGGTKAVYQTVIQSAVRRGSLVVVSAGNSTADLQHGGTFTLPNSVAGAMSISATGPNDELVFYSNYGTNEISVGAPGGGYETLAKTLETVHEDDEGGEDDPDKPGVEWPFPTNLVFNAYMVDADGDSLLEAPSYTWLAGTSMAAPQVTGTAALVREVAPQSTAKQVEKAIEQGADLVAGESDTELGAGRLNADASLDADVID